MKESIRKPVNTMAVGPQDNFVVCFRKQDNETWKALKGFHSMSDAHEFQHEMFMHTVRSGTVARFNTFAQDEIHWIGK